MRAVQHVDSAIWHLLGARGCGVDPAGRQYGAPIDGTWAEIRDHVDRDAGERCRNCRWPPR